MGPTAKDCIIAMFAYLYKTRTISSLAFVLGRLGPLLCFMDMLGYGVLHYSKHSYPLDVMYVMF